MKRLTQRLRYWAQNEEMIDQYYTNHGKDCNEAAQLIDDLEEMLMEARPRMCRNYPTESTQPSIAENVDFGCDCIHCRIGRHFLDSKP